MDVFNPTGPTVLVASDSTAPTGVQPLSVGAPVANVFRIFNAGSVAVHVAHNTAAATAATSAVVPTGTARNSYGIPAGSVFYVVAPPLSFFSAISASAASVFITPGKGF